MISRDTASRRATSAGDGCGMRGSSAPVLSIIENASFVGPPQPVYVRLPKAMMPTPYSGNHRMIEPKPGSPPVCATMCAKSQLVETPSPKPYPPL